MVFTVSRFVFEIHFQGSLDIELRVGEFDNPPENQVSANEGYLGMSTNTE